MGKEIGYILIVCVCAVILIIGLFRKRTEVIVNFVLRLIFGMIGIYLINMFLTWQGLHFLVGMNPISAVTVGILGIPGFLLLYSVVIVSQL